MIAMVPLVVKSARISQLTIKVHKVPVILHEIVLEMLLSLVSLTALNSTSTLVSPQHEIK
jgi:hypothetical protein